MTGEKKEPKSAVLQLLEDYAQDTEEITIYLSKGDAFRFKNMVDALEVRDLHKRALGWAKIFGEVAPKDAKFKQFAHFAQAPDILTSVFILQDLLIEPSLSQADFLKIAHKASHLFDEIKTKFDLASRNVVVIGFNDNLQKRKKKSKKIRSSGAPSESAESHGASIRTSSEGSPGVST